MLSDEIKQFFHGDVLTDEKTLAEYGHDYSIFEVRPQIVVFPKDVLDVKNLVKFVAKKKSEGENISLTGRSAGTDMTGGPLTQSIVVSFTPVPGTGQVSYFNHIKEIGSDYAVVEPGVYFRDFAEQLQQRGLLYPPYPASKDLCALGGMVNNNSGGEKTLAYGKTEDYIEELKIVMGDGELHTLRPMSAGELRPKLQEESFEGDIYRRILELIEKNYDEIHAAKPAVSKNSSGYFLWNVWDRKTFDITKLIVGSQGTLGLLTEAKLRLVKAKKYSRLAVIFLRDLAPLGNLIVELLKFKPESMESYDDKTLWVALRFLPSIIKSMKGSFFKLIWKFLPEAIMVLRGGLPKMILLVELTADDEGELDRQMRALGDEVKKFKLPVRLLKDEAEEEKYWIIRRQSFKLLHDHSIGKDTAPFIDDIIVEPKYLPEFLPKLNQILDKYKKDLIYTVAGHPGNGNFHVIPLMDLKDKRVRDLIPVISDEVYKLVFAFHGSMSAEHNDGLIRTPYLEAMYGKKMASLFEGVKEIFDPQNIFNPGKKVGGSLEYSLEHVKRD
ncbi:MAG: FAD-binding oxidoreductase [Candidatus Liptonbacteria bacterium]|nr:FAD-binding oxidoreductase [Candidatus Liptonbacteria bacterium]